MTNYIASSLPICRRPEYNQSFETKCSLALRITAIVVGVLLIGAACVALWLNMTAYAASAFAVGGALTFSGALIKYMHLPETKVTQSEADPQEEVKENLTTVPTSPIQNNERKELLEESSQELSVNLVENQVQEEPVIEEPQNSLANPLENQEEIEVEQESKDIPAAPAKLTYTLSIPNVVWKKVLLPMLDFSTLRALSSANQALHTLTTEFWTEQWPILEKNPNAFYPEFQTTLESRKSSLLNVSSMSKRMAILAGQHPMQGLKIVPDYVGNFFYIEKNTLYAISIRNVNGTQVEIKSCNLNSKDKAETINKRGLIGYDAKILVAIIIGSRVIFSLKDGTVDIWEIKTCERVATIKEVHRGDGCKLYAFNNILATKDGHSTILKMWYPATGAFIQSVDMRCSFNKNIQKYGDNFYVASHLDFEIFELRDGSKWDFDTVTYEKEGEILDLKIEGDSLYAHCGNGIIKWDLKTKKRQLPLLKHDYITCFAIKNDILFSSSRDGSLKKWNVVTGELLSTKEKETKEGIISLKIFENTLVIQSDYSTSIWDLESDLCLSELPSSIEPLSIQNGLFIGVNEKQHNPSIWKNKIH